MKIDTKKELSNEFGSNIFFDYDLKKRNWFNIGGKCKIFFKAENLKQLINKNLTEVRDSTIYHYVI